MTLFLGGFDHSLDDRGRVTLPRKIRQELTRDEVIVSRGFDQCIFGFDREQWERESQKHLETNLTDPKGREVRRYLFSSAERVEIDKLGRLLLPAQLKEYANIGKDIVVVGAGDHFELWNIDAWMKYSATMKNP